MTLIKSISGIRGTIGGTPGNNLTPVDLVKFASAYGIWLKGKKGSGKLKIVLGRDARISGEMADQLVTSSLRGLGIDIIQTGLVSTPTVEMAVRDHSADGGIILTASHNPANWNALKLLNESGEFISGREGEDILRISANEDFEFADVYNLGRIYFDNNAGSRHIKSILDLDLVDVRSIAEADFTIAVDGTNSVGGIIIPELLKQLGIQRIIQLNCNPDGNFRHNPEPLPENLTELSELVVREKADLGFAVDPDVDRLVMVNENGSMFGEEYTLVAVADYILKHKPGSTVSNLSSSRALKDITEKYGMNYFPAAVGEVNVVEKMKKVNAVIGGEGNGGIIYPELHYGRDALVGVALFLSHLSAIGGKCSELRKSFPEYFIYKLKTAIKSESSYKETINNIRKQYGSFSINEEDGLKIDLPDGWIHIRKSNTEPIVRVISESTTKEKAVQLASDIIKQLQE
jgi:phosphomannomutase